MDIFKFRNPLIDDYTEYINGIVARELSEGALWPQPLIHLNPFFMPVDTHYTSRFIKPLPFFLPDSWLPSIFAHRAALHPRPTGCDGVGLPRRDILEYGTGRLVLEKRDELERERLK